MPIEIPPIDERRYEDLRRELLARIPSHTPEWTNQNASDPGVTLLELFAFLGESILYRANRIPERSRLAFLRLLGVPLLPGSPSRGILEFSLKKSARTELSVTTLATGLEVAAGKVTYHLERGLDVLPLQAWVAAKGRIDPDPVREDSYRRLYASVLDPADQPITLYQTTPLGPEGLRFGPTEETVDGAVWVALLCNQKWNERLETIEAYRARYREAIAGRVLSLGLVPQHTTLGRSLAVNGTTAPETGPGVRIDAATDMGGSLQWLPLGTWRGTLDRAGTIDIPLPAATRLVGWEAAEVLDQGVGDVPPAIDEASVASRLLLWLRLSPVGDPDVRLQWVGVNAAMCTQGDRVYGEPIGIGTGEPDQVFSLARRPLVSGTLRLWVGQEEWTVVDDVLAAPREGSDGAKATQVDCEAGVLRFGTGLAGARPVRGATLRASYEVNAGIAGNVGAETIRRSASAAVEVVNPVGTWGGTAPESVSEGERHVARYLQHRDRLVTIEDFRDLVVRTPGVQMARVEVLPAFHPLIGANRPGDAPGCVTVLGVPHKSISGIPPQPTDEALEAICAWLEPRRLVTTEIFLRGPSYVPVTVSAGIEVTPHTPNGSSAEVREAVRKALTEVLSPVPEGGRKGWALGRTVRAAELMVVVAAVPGVQVVREIRLGDATGTEVAEIAVSGLQLPWLAAISVSEGLAAAISDLMPKPGSSGAAAIPIPVVPDECD